MKFLMAVLMLGSVLSMPAAADVFGGAIITVQDRGAGGKGGREGRPMREARPVQVAPPPREQPRGQMTQEERQQLHRDLDKANRELYRGKR